MSTTAADIGARLSPSRTVSARAAVGTVALVASVAIVIAVVLTATGGGLALVPASRSAFPHWLAGPLPSPGWHVTGTGAGRLVALLTGCWIALVWAGRALPRRATIAAIVIANLAVFLGPPLFSADVFGYIAFGRIGAIHGADPYVHGLADVSPDAVRPFARWHNATSPYGALFTIGSYALAPLGVAAALWGFKLLALVSSLALVAVVWRLAERRGLPPAAVAAFVAFNPLTILFAAGGAHNDVLVTAIGVAGLGLVTADRRPAAGAATVVVAAMTKASAGLLLPFAIIAAEPRRSALKGALVAGVAAVALALVAFGPHALGVTGALTTQQKLVATHSVPNEVGVLLGYGKMTLGIRIAAAVALLVALGFALRSAWRGADPFTAAGWATLAVLVTTAWLVPWYALWLLPLAAVSADRRLRIGTIAITAVIVAAHIPAIGSHV